MKKATEKIINYFPSLKDNIPDCDSILLEEQTLQELSDTEQVFLKMIWFFEQPSQNNFNLYDLLEYLDQDWLSLALESIMTFFYKDNYFGDNPGFSLITDESDYMNQTNFANFLNEHKKLHGRNFSRPMLNSYLNRGIIPTPDLELAGTKYWLKETCESYLNSIANQSKD
ncbi:hypothetical protein [Thalassobacillus sp. B23F22_16]|uniref:hypothetical protein n=1 Tax=Thalassobacillus sp. B23F22_16 TaxID=3459513 RepID=UPI00373E54D9